jgi:hypothetical protein
MQSTEWKKAPDALMLAYSPFHMDNLAMAKDDSRLNKLTNLHEKLLPIFAPVVETPLDESNDENIENRRTLAKDLVLKGGITNALLRTTEQSMRSCLEEDLDTKLLKRISMNNSAYLVS